MYIHVDFRDGSNPWYILNADKKTALKHIKYFRRTYGPAVSITAGCGERQLLHDYNGAWFVRYDNKAKTYKHIGHAINFLLKGEKNHD